GAEVLVEVQRPGAEVSDEELEDPFHRPGEPHDLLFGVAYGRQARASTVKCGSDQLVLVAGAVLEFVQEHVAVGLADGVARRGALGQDLQRKWNQVGKLDLLARDALRPDGVVLVEGVIPGQEWPEPVDQPFGESVERVAVEPAGEVGAAALAHALPEVLGGVDLEGNRQDAARVGTLSGAQQKVGALSEHLGLARARARGEGETCDLLPGGLQRVGLELQAVGRLPTLRRDHSGMAFSFSWTASASSASCAGRLASSWASFKSASACRWFTGLLPSLKRLQ